MPSLHAAMQKSCSRRCDFTMGLTVPVRPLPAFRQTDVQRAAFNEERSLERSSSLAGLQLWPNLKDCIARPRTTTNTPGLCLCYVGGTRNADSAWASRRLRTTGDRQIARRVADLQARAREVGRIQISAYKQWKRSTVRQRLISAIMTSCHAASRLWSDSLEILKHVI
jgi:hypothetical protein